MGKTKLAFFDGDQRMERIKLVFYKGNWYHPNFFKRRATCLKKAKYTCQNCNKKQGDLHISETGNVSKIILQAHHPNNDRTNSRAILVALCKTCHLKEDGAVHKITRKRKKREDEIKNGQLELPFKMRKKSKSA